MAVFVSRLWEVGIDAVHVRDRARLRRSDYELLKYADDQSRAIATINQVDFTSLVIGRPCHNGIAVIPSGGSRDEQLEYLLVLAAYLRTTPPAMDGLKNRIVRVDKNKIVTSRWACSTEMPIGNIAGPSSVGSIPQSGGAY